MMIQMADAAAACAAACERWKTWASGLRFGWGEAISRRTARLHAKESKARKYLGYNMATSTHGANVFYPSTKCHPITQDNPPEDPQDTHDLPPPGILWGQTIPIEPGAEAWGPVGSKMQYSKGRSLPSPCEAEWKQHEGQRKWRNEIACVLARYVPT